MPIFLLLPFAAAAQTLLVFGDSLSAGYGIARESGWVTLMQQALQRSHPGYRVINASLSGETTAGGLRRLPPALQQHRPAIVILELGANDGLRGMPLRETEHNLRQMVQLAQRSGARVLLVGMQIPPNYGLDYAKRFQAIFPKIAQQQRVALLPFLLEGLPTDAFQADNLHPTADAQPRIMQNVWAALLPLLNAR